MAMKIMSFSIKNMGNMLKRSFSLFLVLALVFQLCACGFTQKVSETANNVKDKVVNWYSAIDLSGFKTGWNNALQYAESTYAATLGSKYVKQVCESVNTFKDDINAAYGSARTLASEAGFAAEKWAADTFNIDAAVKGNKDHATVVGSNKLGSVDVITDSGETASLKYYKSASESASEQAKNIIDKYKEYYNSAKNNKNKTPMSLQEYLDYNGYDSSNQDALLASIYEGQTRIIPEKQLEQAKAYLQGKIDELSIDGDVSSPELITYKETLENLKVRLESPDGTKSKPASYEDMQAIAELSQGGEFNPEQFGFRISQLITPKYVVKQAVGTGLKTSALSLVLELGPNIYSILSEATKNGSINKDELKELGIDGSIAASEGFVEGSVSCILVTLCQAGKLGSSLVNASPDMIGALTVLTIDAVRYGYALSKDEITPSDYGNLIAQELIATAVGLSSAALLTMLFGGAQIAYMAGSLAGGLLAAVGYNMAKEALMEIKDGGGFEAVVPINSVESANVGKNTLSNMSILDKITDFKDLVVSIAENGIIKIKAAKA